MCRCNLHIMFVLLEFYKYHYERYLGLTTTTQQLTDKDADSTIIANLLGAL